MPPYRERHFVQDGAEDVHVDALRSGKSKISSWEKFKKHDRAAFLPYNFERELYQCFQNLRQRTRSVDEYTTDFYESLARLDLNESPF
ncbi:reverse transcriptase domain-containing protein [Tanacetum coccineum]